MFTDDFISKITTQCTKAFESLKNKDMKAASIYTNNVYTAILKIKPISCSEGWDIVLSNGKDNPPTFTTIKEALTSAPLKKKHKY